MLARVIRADAVEEGDTDTHGNPIKVAGTVEHEDHLATKADQDASLQIVDGEVVPGVVPNEMIGSSPQLVTLEIDGEEYELSPSDLIVVMR